MPAGPPQNHPVKISQPVWEIIARAKPVALESKIRIHGIYGRYVLHVDTFTLANDLSRGSRYFAKLQSPAISRPGLDY